MSPTWTGVCVVHYSVCDCVHLCVSATWSTGSCWLLWADASWTTEITMATRGWTWQGRCWPSCSGGGASSFTHAHTHVPHYHHPSTKQVQFRGKRFFQLTHPVTCCSSPSAVIGSCPAGGYLTGSACHPTLLHGKVWHSVIMCSVCPFGDKHHPLFIITGALEHE